MYKFSAPMPYTKENINKLLNINKNVEKSKITSLYNCLPSNCSLFTGFEQKRNFSFEHSDFEYWKELICYTFENGADFIYLLNLPKPLDVENENLISQLEKLENLLFELKKIGVNKLRVASLQLSSYIGKHYKDFNIFASTSLDYKNIWEYQNFIQFHPEVKQIIPSHDINKNFKLLSILSKRYPNTEIELMVNEGCLQGCPNRFIHEYINIEQQKIINNEICLSNSYPTSFCNPVVHKYPVQSLVIGNHIFPWDIEEYSKIGINNFKLVGRDSYNHFENYLSGFTMYLTGIDDINNIKDYSLAAFTHHLQANPILKQLKVKDYKKYLPKIRHFKQKGHLCASRCGVECKYCYNCAEKIQKAFVKNRKKTEENNVIPCFI